MNGAREIYLSLLHDLEQLMPSRTDAFDFFWFMISGWVKEYEIVCKTDFVGSLMLELIGDNLRCEIYREVESQSKAFEENVKNYGLGESINEIGTYWRDLIRQRKLFRIRSLHGILIALHDEITPLVYNRACAWAKEESGAGTVVTQKEYRRCRAELRKVMGFIELMEDHVRLEMCI